MGHDTTEIGVVMALEISFALFVHVHNAVRPPFHIIADAAVVRTVQDKRVLRPCIIVRRAIWRERQSKASCILCERVRESPIGIFIALFYTKVTIQSQQAVLLTYCLCL